MVWDNREGWPYRARNAVEQFKSRGIELNETTVNALAVLDRIEATAPQKQDGKTIRNLIVAGADRDDIDRALLRDATHAKHVSEHAQARVIAAYNVMTAICDDRDALHAALELHATEVIGQLTAVAELGSSNTLDKLVSEGRHKEAEALVAAASNAAELDNLYETRDHYLTPPGYGYGVGAIDCGRWVDPRVGAHFANTSAGMKRSEYFLYVIRSGGELWFPTAEEAVQRAREVHAEIDAQNKRRGDGD